MRIHEIADAQAQLGLLRTIIDNTWTAIAQQAAQQQKADALRKAQAKATPSRRKPSKGGPVKALAPPPPPPTPTPPAQKATPKAQPNPPSFASKTPPLSPQSTSLSRQPNTQNDVLAQGFGFNNAALKK